MGFYPETGKNLRPTGILLFNWLHGKDACVDVTGGSPFVGAGVSSWGSGISLANAEERKRKKSIEMLDTFISPKISIVSIKLERVSMAFLPEVFFLVNYCDMIYIDH